MNIRRSSIRFYSRVMSKSGAAGIDQTLLNSEENSPSKWSGFSIKQLVIAGIISVIGGVLSLLVATKSPAELDTFFIKQIFRSGMTRRARVEVQQACEHPACSLPQ